MASVHRLSPSFSLSSAVCADPSAKCGIQCLPCSVAVRPGGSQLRKVKPPRAAAAETVAIVAEVLCISLLFCSPVFFPITATPDYAHTV